MVTTMNRFRTVADLQRLHDESPWRRRSPMLYFPPDMADVPLWMSTNRSACLIHITRVVTWTPAYCRWPRPETRPPIIWQEKITPHAWCGVFGSTKRDGSRWRTIDPADATFVCSTCERRAREYGFETYGLIPDTGCAATGGARYRPKNRA